MQDFILTVKCPAVYIDDLEPEKGAETGKVDGVVLLAVNSVTVATLGPADRDVLVDEDEAEFTILVKNQPDLSTAEEFLEEAFDRLSRKYQLFS